MRDGCDTFFKYQSLPNIVYDFRTELLNRVGENSAFTLPKFRHNDRPTDRLRKNLGGTRRNVRQ